MTTPQLLDQAQSQDWFWYEIVIASVVTLVSGAMVWRRGFLSALIVLATFFYYSIWVPFQLTVSLGAKSETAIAAQAAAEASQSYYTFLFSMGAPAALISAVWFPFLVILLAMHWRTRRTSIGAVRAFLDQNIVSAAMGVFILYGAFAIAAQMPTPFLFDLNAAVFCAWLVLLITQNRTRWAPYGALIWLIALHRIAAHISQLDMSLAIALYAAATIALGAGLLMSRLAGNIPTDAVRMCVALLIIVNVSGTLLFVNSEFERQVATQGLRQPEFRIYAPLYLLIIAAVVAGVSAVLLQSQPAPPGSVWRGQLISPRGRVVLTRYLGGFWGRTKKLEDFPFFSQGEALLRHLRGDDRTDLVSVGVFVALLGYLGWATWYGPLAPFVSIIDPSPEGSDSARVVQFGLLAYLIGRITRFRLYAYLGVIAILWSGLAALDLQSWGRFAEGSPGQTGGFSEIAGAGAASALFFHRLANFLGPHVIVPGVGLIACEVIRAMIDPMRERLSARLAFTPGPPRPASGRGPSWLVPTASSAVVLVGAMVAIAAWGGGGAAVVDAMAMRTAPIAASPSAVVLRLAAMSQNTPAGGGVLTVQSIQFADWSALTPPESEFGAVQSTPAAIALARLDLPGGAMREVAYQIFRAPNGARIVITLSPVVAPDMSGAARGPGARAGPRGRAYDERLYAALRTQLEALLVDAPASEDAFAEAMLDILPSRPFIYVQAASEQEIDAALDAAAGAIAAHGLASDAVAHVVRLSGGGYLAGYAYEHFGAAPDPASLNNVRLGELPAGHALRVSAAHASDEPGAVTALLNGVARAAGLEAGTLIEVRSESMIIAASEFGPEAGVADYTNGRDYYLMVSGPTAHVGCILAAMRAGYGHCEITQSAP